MLMEGDLKEVLKTYFSYFTFWSTSQWGGLALSFLPRGYATACVVVCIFVYSCAIAPVNFSSLSTSWIYFAVAIVLVNF